MFLRFLVPTVAILLLFPNPSSAQLDQSGNAGVDPLDLRFHRQAVRRFVFAQDIPLGGLIPGQIFGFTQTNPVFETPGESPCRFVENKGTLEIQPFSPTQVGDASVWVSGINPYATYS